MGFEARSLQSSALSSTRENGYYIGGYDAGGVLRIMSAVRGNRKS